MQKIDVTNQQMYNVVANTAAYNIMDRSLTRNECYNSIVTNNNNNNSINAVVNNMNSSNSTNIFPSQEASMLHSSKCVSTINSNNNNGARGDESISTLGLSYTVKEISQSNDLMHKNINTESMLISNQCNNTANCANDMCWLNNVNYASLLYDN